MRRSLRWTWPILIVALLVGLPWACHVSRPEKPIDLVVVDKTVPFRNWLEHRSLFWLLRHDRYVSPEGEPFETERDYLGAYPPEIPGDPPESTHDLTPGDVATADVLYLVDTYGVYEEDLESGPEMKAALERSPKIYGGLGAEEAEAAIGVAARGATLLVEFNTLASPTGEAARERMEEALGVRWTRWIGRFFPRLEETEDVPGWIRRNYEREWGRPWDFDGPGYVLLKDDAHVEVLRTGVEAERIGLRIDRVEPVDAVLDRAGDGVSYPYWFSVVERDGAPEQLATFRWQLSDEGRERLAARGLPLEFPAVTRMRRGNGTAYYFAGDFADNPMADYDVPLAGYPRFRRWLERVRWAPSEDAFYWRFYVPMMRRILEDARAARS